jgi:Catalytic LigB subunit of aromatic ring-opening dioxygenase
MAEIVLGIASSHAPQLEMPPQNWREYAMGNRRNNEHWFAGKTYTFQELVDARRGDHFENECTDEKFQTRWDSCQKSIAHLADTLGRVAPDVVVILGDDQKEAFDDDNMPALGIYYGETVDDAPTRTGARADLSDPKVANGPRARVSHPTEAALGEYLIERFIEAEFDVARSKKMPVGRRDGAIGHAFYYVYRRLMDNEVIPNVPILVNTYYPPNTPTAARCYKFGQVLRQAIEGWDSDKRVAIVASGGLSHTVIEEDLDYRILDGLKHNDVHKLTDYSDLRFRAGTSEIKNWIILGGAMAGDGLQMNTVDYVPCYRTEAGNGCAMGFAEWL